MTIIAECCSNHGGDMRLARGMILSAKENGADLVKFQLYDAEDDKGKPHYEWVKKAELTFEQAKMLFDYGHEVGIEVFFSVFGVKYVDWCEGIGVKRYKISSGTRENSIINAVISTHKIVIHSFDNSSPMWDIAINLYCVSKYPTTIGDMNFRWIHESAGFSDHTIGLDAAKIALARGAQIIEKHFILDREHSQSPEKDWSMTPDELRELKRWGDVCQEVLG